MPLTGSPRCACSGQRAHLNLHSDAPHWHQQATGTLLHSAVQCSDVCLYVCIKQYHKNHCNIKRKMKLKETPDCDSVMRDGDWNEYTKKTEKERGKEKKLCCITIFHTISFFLKWKFNLQCNTNAGDELQFQDTWHYQISFLISPYRNIDKWEHYQFMSVIWQMSHNAQTLLLSLLII